MLGAVACLVLIHGSPVVQARNSRLAFTQAMAKVKVGWTRAQVRAVVGEPDDIWPINDSELYVQYGDEYWCYGTNGHHTMPTLGYVVFRGDKVLTGTPRRSAPPPTSVISDQELISAMRTLYLPPKDRFPDYDIRHMIRAANVLIGAGQKKSFAILKEFDNLSVFRMNSDWLFWLIRVAYTSSRPGNVFPIPAIGSVQPAPPEDMRKWPTYPMIIADHIPFCLYRGAFLAGVPEPFERYLQSHQSEWTIKKKRLAPPSDPFATFKNLIQSDRWPLPHTDAKRSFYSYPYAEGDALRQVLDLVQTAYSPPINPQLPHYTNWLDGDKYQKEYLALNCRWNSKHQKYVRKDGSSLPESTTEESIQFHHDFAEIPRLNVGVTLSRVDSGYVRISTIVYEMGSEPISTAILVALEAESGKELAWGSLGIDRAKTMDEVLKMPRHKPTSLGAGFGVNCPKGTKISLEVVFDGKRYVSPVFEP